MKNLAIRDIFGLTLRDLGKKNKKIFAISPDLKAATKLSYFFEEFPERSIETGIAEANAIGISAGLALAGLKPVVSSFGAFLTGKNVEIRTSISFNNANVIIAGTHGGLIGPDGPSQAGLQDIAVMRSIPNMSVYQPATAIETKKILEYSIKANKPIYIRISRQANKEFFTSNYKFIEGSPVTLNKNFKDGIVISSGNTLQNCHEAVEKFKKLGKKIGLINIPSIKPLNKSKIKNLLRKTNKVFTIEDHNIYGGLGSAILESLSDLDKKPKIYMHGLKDVFIQSDEVENLYKYYGLDSKGIFKFINKNI
tara:strand:- start:887 stop:1813 length:927 start_codon:yes stop_codon:yes gene_type:complete